MTADKCYNRRDRKKSRTKARGQHNSDRSRGGKISSTTGPEESVELPIDSSDDAAWFPPLASGASNPESVLSTFLNGPNESKTLQTGPEQQLTLAERLYDQISRPEVSQSQRMQADQAVVTRAMVPSSESSHRSRQKDRTRCVYEETESDHGFKRPVCSIFGANKQFRVRNWNQHPYTKCSIPDGAHPLLETPNLSIMGTIHDEKLTKVSLTFLWIID